MSNIFQRFSGTDIDYIRQNELFEAYMARLMDIEEGASTDDEEDSRENFSPVLPTMYSEDNIESLLLPSPVSPSRSPKKVAKQNNSIWGNFKCVINRVFKMPVHLVIQWANQLGYKLPWLNSFIIRHETPTLILFWSLIVFLVSPRSSIGQRIRIKGVN